jgi:hypothetical protein
MPEPSSGILGRISGKLLSANLERDGIDLTVRNNPLDADLFYLDVNNLRVGINQTPGFDLHISDGISTNSIVDNQLVIANNDLILTASQISSLTSEITLSPDQSSSPSIIMERNQTSELEINDNYISNYTIDGSINLNTSGAGIIRLENDIILDGDLYVTGDITIAGNLSKQGNLIIGDDVIDGEGNVPENDTVDFNVPFAQNLLPGLDSGYDLGGSRGDSSAGRWAELYVTDNLVNTADILTLGATVSDQLFVDGVNGQILSLQSNDDVRILPDTGVTRIENIIIQQNFLVNIYSDATPIIFASTGTGYYNFSGTNGMVFPAGTISERADYEVGATRWNTDTTVLECFDGTTWNLSTGIGDVTVAEMEELGVIYSLTLG